MKDSLDADAQQKLSQIPDELRAKWGRSGVWSPFENTYTEKTVIDSPESAYEAFKKYTEYFNHVMEQWEPTSDTLVLVPCGASKPIGSSTIHQKKITAIREGGLTDADIVVVSEPCTVVPPEYRLSVPAVNYEFPPEYTDKTECPDVFNVFTNRLAEWLDKMDYSTIYPYLISGHQNKFDVAYEKMDSSPDVYEIPSASYNAETGSYSGDRFKKQCEMNQKVRAVQRFKAEKPVSVKQGYHEFYRQRWAQ